MKKCVQKISSGIVFSTLAVFSAVSFGSSSPLDWPVGAIDGRTLYEYESDGSGRIEEERGHTIRHHIGKSYSYLAGRCVENNSGTFTSFENSRIAYDRIKKTFRRNENVILSSALVPEIVGPRGYYTFRNVKSNKFGDFVRCSSHPLLRYALYLAEGTNKTEIQIIFNKLTRNNFYLLSGYPAK